MKIRSLKLKNFRCFGEEEKCLPFDDITTFIGINSCGKTAVLMALTKLFGRSGNIRALERSDFHTPFEKKPEEMASQSLYVEVVIEFPELDSQDEIAKNSVPPFFDHMHVDEPNGKPYVRIRLEGTWSPGNTPEGDIDQNTFFIVAPESVEINDEHKKPASAADLSKIEIIYVPAVRNPASQLINTSGTILWRILSGINWPIDTNQKIKAISDTLDEELKAVGGFSELQGVLLGEWKKLHSDVRYTNVHIGFTAEDLTSVLNKIDVRFSPTEVPGSYSVESLGEGLRSLFYLSLVSSLLELENHAIKEAHKTQTDPNKKKLFNSKFTPPQLTILAIEEPENHIAPYLVGRIMGILKTISHRMNAQVLVTSHSPSIVKRVEPETIRYLRICPKRHWTLVSSIILPEATDARYKYIKEAVSSYPEIYFARLVVLGEGDTEEIVIPKALQLSGKSLDETSVVVVPLGGRFVNHFWKLLSEIDIPYVTLLDLDLGRETGGWARIQYILYQLLENGVDRKSLVEGLVADGVIKDDAEIEKLKDRVGQRDLVNKVIRALEKHNIFFASPLDMDFTMLNAFSEAYEGTIEETGGSGPRIPDLVSDPEGYKNKISLATKATLKSDEATGDEYSTEEKSLMIWYKYLFLERGKPGTHILALTKIAERDFSKGLPETIKRMTDTIQGILEKDPYAVVST